MIKPLIIVFMLAVSIIGCTPQDEQLTTDADIKLRFSEDTVLFDTILSSVSSVTKRFKVYNDDKNAVFTNVKLGTLFSSPYKIWVNGVENVQHSDVLLFGKDSLLILVEVEIDPQDEALPYLVKDSVVFTTNGNTQHVKLVAYGQDANFLKDAVLPCNTTWSAGKPYVILGTATVPMGCNLTIEQGAKVLFNYKAKLKVEGSLTVTGTASDPVAFCNDNDLSSYPEKALGYWRGIEFTSTSTGNSLDWTLIKNSERGLYFRAGGTVDSTMELTVDHTIIKDMSKAGIEAYGVDMVMSNSVVTNCAGGLVLGLGGGNYSFIHTTFANYSYDFFREGPALQFNNSDNDNGINVMNPLKTGLENSIIWGNSDEEITLINPAQFYAAHSLFKSNTTISGTGNLFNKDPGFINPRVNNLQLTPFSKVINKGAASLSLPIDLNGVSRGVDPEMGAYEYVP